VSLSFGKRAVCDVVGTIKGKTEPGEKRKSFDYLVNDRDLGETL